MFCVLCTAFVPQEMFRLESPGGGGYGDIEDTETVATPPAKKARVLLPTGSVANYTAAQESA